MTTKWKGDAQTKHQNPKKKGMKNSQTLSWTASLSWRICRFFSDLTTAAATTATMRTRWMGLKSSQARACWGVKQPPMARAEVASSAPRRRPWRETHARAGFFRPVRTGLVGLERWVDSRRGFSEVGMGVNGERVTWEGSWWTEKSTSRSSSAIVGGGERGAWILKVDVLNLNGCCNNWKEILILWEENRNRNGACSLWCEERERETVFWKGKGIWIVAILGGKVWKPELSWTPGAGVPPIPLP